MNYTEQEKAVARHLYTEHYGFAPSRPMDETGVAYIPWLDRARNVLKVAAGGPVYDSRRDTLDHIDKVRELLDICISGLNRRGLLHDKSKLESPEKEIFDKVTPRLRELTYGSEEYRASLAEMGSALDHHYAVNDHHPEHHPDGMRGMDLLQLLEMLCDWVAATQRHDDGDIFRSIEINKERFGSVGFGDELERLLVNTLPTLGISVPVDVLLHTRPGVFEDLVPDQPGPHGER